MNKDWLEATRIGDCDRVRSLLDAGADIDSLDDHGQTALMNAAYRGDDSLVRVLVDHGANLDHTAKYRLTALMLAVINGHKETVRMLVEAGANTKLKGSTGHFERTPLEYATEFGNDDMVNILRKYT